MSDYEYVPTWRPVLAAAPCPFCGHTRPVMVMNARAPYRVRCGIQRCDARGPGRRSYKGAVNAWNRRPPHDR